ncbi:MAG: exodeoxyribonuclease VII small subunit [Pirellulales bacterium]
MPECEDAKPTFEQALAQLAVIVQELENGQTGLAEALARYEEGVKLLKQCYGLLEHAERKIELLTGLDASGGPATQPFNDTGDVPLEDKAQARSKRRSKPPEVARPQAARNEMDEPTGLF